MRPQPDATAHQPPRPDDESVEVVLAGDLDMGATFRIELEVDRLLTAHGIKRLVVNLADVTFVDSAGLGALASISERAQQLGVEMRLANVSNPVRRVLDLSGAVLAR